MLNDPMVLFDAQALLTSTPEGRTAYVAADLRDIPAITEQAARTLDFWAPVALMLLIILHMIPDEDDPYGIVATLVEALPVATWSSPTRPATSARRARRK